MWRMNVMSTENLVKIAEKTALIKFVAVRNSGLSFLSLTGCSRKLNICYLETKVAGITRMNTNLKIVKSAKYPLSNASTIVREKPGKNKKCFLKMLTS